jgi:hypothetical protein
MWFQIVNNLVDLMSKYNNVENLLEDTNNQLQVCCLELVSRKQALLNKYKDLAIVKSLLFKQ